MEGQADPGSAATGAADQKRVDVAAVASARSVLDALLVRLTFDPWDLEAQAAMRRFLSRVGPGAAATAHRLEQHVLSTDTDAGLSVRASGDEP